MNYNKVCSKKALIITNLFHAKKNPEPRTKQLLRKVMKFIYLLMQKSENIKMIF